MLPVFCTHHLRPGSPGEADSCLSAEGVRLWKKQKLVRWRGNRGARKSFVCCSKFVPVQIPKGLFSQFHRTFCSNLLDFFISHCYFFEVLVRKFLFLNENMSLSYDCLYHFHQPWFEKETLFLHLASRLQPRPACFRKLENPKPTDHSETSAPMERGTKGTHCLLF